MTRMDRSGSLLGKRASIVTGGYETSESSDADDDDGHDGQNGHAPAGGPANNRPTLDLPSSFSFGAAGTSAGSTQPLVAHRGAVHRTHSAEGRRRSKSLMSPTMEEVFESSGSQHQLQLQPQLQPRDKDRERRKRPKDGRRGSRDMLRPSESFKKAKGDKDRDGDKDKDKDGIRSEAASPAEAGAGRVVDGLRRTESPERASDRDHDRLRKGKGRARPINGLASSLGLVATKGDVALSAGTSPSMCCDKAHCPRPRSS
jgi:hypothetical protein